MLEQIVTRTPVWVWALLAFLIYRGLAARIDREVPFWTVFIVPLVMLGLSLQDVLARFPGPVSLAIWFACLLAGMAGSMKLARPGAVQAAAQPGKVILRGSPIPLALMMAVFSVKYAVGVTLALQPALQQQPGFVAVVCALYGSFSGVFVGQLLHVCAIYRTEVGRT